jgi:hypothetical protein
VPATQCNYSIFAIPTKPSALAAAILAVPIPGCDLGKPVGGLAVRPDPPAASLVRLLTDHPYADAIGRAGHDLVHERFCVELMVRAVETIYDEAVADERRLAAG